MFWSLAPSLSLAFGLVACSDGNGGPGPVPTYDSLNVPRSILLDTGEVAFATCAGCHGARGVGMAEGIPPLLHSDYAMEDRLRPLRIMLLGLPNVIDTATVITVRGLNYQDVMPAVAHDEEWSNLRIAAVLTYLRVSLNDTLASNCNPAVKDEQGFATCTYTPRPVAEVETDSVAVWEVKAIRDSLTAAGLLTH